MHSRVGSIHLFDKGKRKRWVLCIHLQGLLYVAYLFRCKGMQKGIAKNSFQLIRWTHHVEMKTKKNHFTYNHTFLCWRVNRHCGHPAWKSRLMSLPSLIWRFEKERERKKRELLLGFIPCHYIEIKHANQINGILRICFFKMACIWCVPEAASISSFERAWYTAFQKSMSSERRGQSSLSLLISPYVCYNIKQVKSDIHHSGCHTTGYIQLPIRVEYACWASRIVHTSN